ncbi:MAG: cation:dicarboxylase symporter family transporter [Neisseriaceae bacterium]
MNYLLLFLFYLVLFSTWRWMPKHWNLSSQVLSQLLIGVILGLCFRLIPTEPLPSHLRAWIDLIGQGYIILLQMIVMPFIFISILSAIIQLHQVHSLGKIAFITLSLLLGTTAIAACIGISYALLFQLNFPQPLSHISAPTFSLASMQPSLEQLKPLNSPMWLLNLLPKNPFLDLAGVRPTSIISTVIFSSLLGWAAIKVRETQPKQGKKLFWLIKVLQIWVMKLVRLILQFSPYGVMALMVSIMLQVELEAIHQLGRFIVTSYLAIFTVFVMHYLLLGLVKVSPLNFLKKTGSLLLFAFGSRSSAACVPMNIEVQTRALGIPPSIATFVATFGTTIGQNGCAGLYPAMLAIMVAPTVGISPVDPSWLVALVFTVTLGSIGVAGVGGGAIFAALIVFSALQLPLTSLPILIAIEPLIDMGRTALNVNGTLVVGMLTSKILPLINPTFPKKN